MNKKYNIAISGTFDVENYGDLMFPILFERELQKRKLQVNLKLFSPIGSNSMKMSGGNKVYPYNVFQEENEKTPFDAVVIGGGAIVHLNKIPIYNEEGKFNSDYPSINAWLPIMVEAISSGIPVYFNLPQAPYEFSELTAPFIKKFLERVDYLSVRDRSSQENIIKTGIPKEKIVVCPDSICDIPNIISKKELKPYLKELNIGKEKYATIHFSKWISSEDIEELKEIVNIFDKEGYRVILLPLGYTHDDYRSMADFNRSIDNKCIFFKEKLNVFQMTAILAYCDYYVGTSFHGSVVTVAYGGKAINFNGSRITPKNKELYSQLGIKKYLAKTKEESTLLLMRLLKGAEYAPDIQNSQKAISRHFDVIVSKIIDSKKINKTNFSINDVTDILSEAEINVRKIISLEEEVASDNRIINEQKQFIDKIKNLKIYKISKKIKTAKGIICHQ